MPEQPQEPKKGDQGQFEGQDVQTMREPDPTPPPEQVTLVSEDDCQD